MIRVLDFQFQRGQGIAKDLIEDFAFLRGEFNVQHGWVLFACSPRGGGRGFIPVTRRPKQQVNAPNYSSSSKKRAKRRHERHEPSGPLTLMPCFKQ